MTIDPSKRDRPHVRPTRFGQNKGAKQREAKQRGRKKGVGSNTVRHDYCAIPPPIESGVWVILATRNSETYARSWASCRSGATSPARIHPASINCAEQYWVGSLFH